MFRFFHGGWWWIKKSIRGSHAKTCRETENGKSRSEISYYVSQGYAEEEIVEAAAKNKIDMIVMGTQGASGIRKLWLER